MRNLLVVAVLTFCATTLTQAQVVEEIRGMSAGSENSLSISLNEPNAKVVTKLWTRFVKDLKGKGKTKRDRKTKEIFTDDISFAMISGSNTMDMYATISPSGEKSNLTVWYDLGGTYLSSSEHPEKYVEGEKLLYKFALVVARDVVERELKEEEKTLKKMNGELGKLQKENNKLLESIEEYKRKIVEAENGVVKNDEEQVRKNNEIELQNEVIKQVKARLDDLR